MSDYPIQEPTVAPEVTAKVDEILMEEQQKLRLMRSNLICSLGARAYASAPFGQLDELVNAQREVYSVVQFADLLMAEASGDLPELYDPVYDDYKRETYLGVCTEAYERWKATNAPEASEPSEGPVELEDAEPKESMEVAEASCASCDDPSSCSGIPDGAAVCEPF